jgi:glucose/arabinose dehydrogenase
VAARSASCRTAPCSRLRSSTFSQLVDIEGEGGLLSLAFAPDYESSGRFYVAFVARDADPTEPPFGPLTIMEFLRSPTDPNLADQLSAREVLAIAHEDTRSHYGGQIQFGPDALLYISTGDGGLEGEAPENEAQNTDSLLGKILRIDPRHSAPYRIPDDNPFFGDVPGDDRVWAYGFRNPYRFSFDRSTGDLSVGDVGVVTIEEVDFVPQSEGGGRGANFGWDACEGNLAFPITDERLPCQLPGRTDPVLQYEHASNPGGCTGTVIGGYVVRDPSLEELFGRYVYGDFCLGWLRSAVLETPLAGDNQPTGLIAPLVTSFGEDGCGQVYVASLLGPVWRLADSTPGHPCGPGH